MKYLCDLCLQIRHIVTLFLAHFTIVLGDIKEILLCALMVVAAVATITINAQSYSLKHSGYAMWTF